VVSGNANTTLSDITVEQGGFLNCLQGSDFTSKILNITLRPLRTYCTFIILLLVFYVDAKNRLCSQKLQMQRISTAVKSYKVFFYEEQMNATML